MRQGELKEAVRERYSKKARNATSCCGTTSDAQGLYTTEQLKTMPLTVIQASAGCGNPTALAQLREGEVVLDLGSGGGIDCFLAARQVGERGLIIGVDMTSEMVALARSNAARLRLSNVQFLLADMESLPVSDNSVDVVISNCVINLSPDKDAVFREAFRVLKPGGRLSISDILLEGELPDEIKQDAKAWTGCIAGAEPSDVYLGRMKKAGLQVVSVAKRPFYGCADYGNMPEVVSAEITVVKPPTTSG